MTRMFRSLYLLVAGGLLLIAVSACNGGSDDGGDEGSGGSSGSSSSSTGSSSSGSSSSSSSSSGSSGSSSSGGDGDSPPAFTFGYPVYTRAEIDAWSVSSPEYTRLAQSWGGNVNRAYTTSYGEEISSEERILLKDDSVYMKVQAVLWAADEDAARRDKVAAMLDELHSVTSWQTDTSEQYRLEAGWLCTNLAQAAAIIDYRDDALDRFLADVCYPILDWTNGPNWHASFADSRLAIAAYVGDSALWEDARAYFYRRIAQSIYHSSYDGGQVTPLLNDSGSPHVSLTKLHWGSAEIPQIHDDFSPIDAEHFVDGTNAERTRDLSHVSMGLGAWMHAARTLLAQGETIEAHAYDRLRAAYKHHGDRVLSYLDTGVIPAPEPNRGAGGNALEQGWFGACWLFGSDTPGAVDTLCHHAAVTGHSATGANHLVAEAFADGAG